MNDSERKWMHTEIEKFVKEYGSVPPPWYVYPQIHPYSIGWRMGAGEGHLMVFNGWWENQNFDEAQRIDYFRKWPPPPRWLEWTISALWEVPAWDDDFDSAPYYERAEQLGFGSKADFENDISDPKWLNDRS